MQNDRSGFTMIELVFVIVILGILAAVAIPKIAATRTDAMQAKAESNLATCITDLGMSYTSTETAINPASSAACVIVTNIDKCFTLIITSSSLSHINDSVEAQAGSSNTPYCIQARQSATTSSLMKQYVFGGKRVTR